MTPRRDYIAKLVHERNWSDSEFARELGISRAEANRFMKGQREGGKKLIGGLIRAFPNESIETLFILPHASPVNTERGDAISNTKHMEMLHPVKNLNNSLVAKMNYVDGVIEIAEHGYITQFQVPPGTEIKVVHFPPPTAPS